MQQLRRLKPPWLLWFAPDSEPGHDILQFCNFGRRRDGDGALQIAAAPTAQIQQEFQNIQYLFALARGLHQKMAYTCKHGRGSFL